MTGSHDQPLQSVRAFFVPLTLLLALLLVTIVVPAHGQAPGFPAEPDAAADQYPYPQHIPAPGLAGGVAWINTSGPLELKDLRGKFVLLDFWTYCCINCMHILPELKKLEEAYPNNLVVVGVHSAKFETEEDSQNITDAVLRYEIKHPVVNDSRHAIWDRYGVRSWPTMLLIDPEGNAFYMRSGEFKADDIEERIKQGLPYFRKKGTLDEKPLRFELAAEHATDTPLRYPGKVLADEASNRLFIADSNHNRIVVAGLDGRLIATIGRGTIGADDGDYATASFHHPQGMALVDNTLYVADTENHMLRKVDLDAQRVATVAGDGRQASVWPGLDPKTFDPQNAKLPERWAGKPRTTELNSPWDLFVHGRDLYIAMAGPHQIWRMPLDESEISVYAGNGREDIVDGPLVPRQPYEQGYASFAQPSGLASDGHNLFVADSEGSSIRTVPFDAKQRVHTLVGTANLTIDRRLFTFGDQDGTGRNVKFQHPLGVAFAGGTLYVADTYNNKIKAIDLSKKSVHTVAGTGKAGHDDAEPNFDEPAGLSAAGGKLYVADTNSHTIRTIELNGDHRVTTLEIAGLTPPAVDKPAASATAVPAAAGADRGEVVRVDPVTLKPQDGLVWLSVKLSLPVGWKINPLAPMRYKVTAPAGAGPVDRAAVGRSLKVDPPNEEFQVEVPIAAADGKDTVDVTLDYYYCQDGPSGVCKAGRVTWTVPLSVNAAADKSTAPLAFKAE